MKRFSLILIAIAIGCAPPEGELAGPPQPHYITIAVDLSDRLRNENQSDKDLRDISYIADYFFELVRSRLFIASRDRLSVVIVRQTTNPDTQGIADALIVDVGAIPLQTRRYDVPERIARLIGAVDSLYTVARQHRTFSGADISGFIAEDLYVPRETPDGVPIKHTLIILCDGYIIDEHNRFTEGKGSNYIPREALIAARQSPGGDNQDEPFYLIPVRDDLSHVGILVLELDPHPGHFGELGTLRKFWGAWFDSMNVGDHEIHKTTDNTATARDVITRFLNR